MRISWCCTLSSYSDSSQTNEEDGYDELEPHRNNINETSKGIESQELFVKIWVGQPGAELSCPSNDSGQDSQDHEREVNDWNI